MLIPKCCKGCSGRKNSVCNCTLPTYCQEYVEDDEVISSKAINIQDLGNQVKFPDYEDFKKQIKEKDHRITVLERALEMACQELRDEYCRHCDTVNGGCTRFEMCDKVWNMYPKQDFIERAEKELEGKK